MKTMHRAGTAQPIRVTENINGRAHAIEVRAVDRNRWRAQLAQRGTANALMPFYGATPDEAVAHLTAWLARVGCPGVRKSN